MHIKKLLPLAESPKISHQFYALPLSIIFANENMWDWYYSEFIQMLTIRNEHEGIMLRTYNYGSENDYDPLEYLKLNPYRLEVGKDIIDIYRKLIDNEYYIYVFCDDSYISTMNVRYHRFHDLLIRGYDEETQVLKVYSYNGPKLSEFDVPYGDFVKAYGAEEVKDIHQLTILYRRKKEHFELNLEKIKWHLFDYIEGVDTIKRERTYLPRLYKPSWGINIYDELVNMFDGLYQNKQHIGSSEVYCLYEHKKDMVNRIAYLSKKSNLKYTNNIFESFKAVEKESLQLVNLTVKIDMRGYKVGDFEKLKGHINHLKQIEKGALDSYVSYNRKVFEEI